MDFDVCEKGLCNEPATWMAQPERYTRPVPRCDERAEPWPKTPHPHAKAARQWAGEARADEEIERP